MSFGPTTSPRETSGGKSPMHAKRTAAQSSRGAASSGGSSPPPGGSIPPLAKRSSAPLSKGASCDEFEFEARVEAERASYKYRPGLMANTKLLDFGISRLGGEASPGADDKGSASPDRRARANQSQASEWLDTATGTPAFYAPEMCRKGGYLGRPADLWAAGVTLCMLTGSSPFAAEHMPAVFERIQHSEPDLPPAASGPLIQLLRRMLNKSPAERITMTELFHDPWVTDGGRFPMPTNFRQVRRSGSLPLSFSINILIYIIDIDRYR